MTQDAEQLLELFEALCDGAIAPDQHERLQERLAADPAARRLYFDYLDLRLHLRQWQRASLGENVSTGGYVGDEPPAGPIIIETAACLPVAASAPLSQLGGFAFSYVAAVLIVGIGLLLGWAYEVSIPRPDHQQSARNDSPPVPEPLPPRPEPVYVGRITGMSDCQWVNSHDAPIGYDRIVLGRKYALASGLMEITYDGGAHVILQGPCSYEVQSPNSGYLSLGRVTARVEKKAEGGRRKAEGSETRTNAVADAQLAGPRSRFPASPSPLFSVRTPTAIVTDLGTEFGVEVDRSGVSEAHVFRGKVELQAVDGRGVRAEAIPLGENESARVDPGKGRIAKVVRQSDRPSQYVRRMPRRVPIKLFNTGANLKPGDPDPHWQLVARSDDAKFKPQQAEVIESLDPRWVPNQADRSQWIAGVGGVPIFMPDDVIYTFRTQFDLAGMRPATAILHGQFVADNSVRAIRLNGHNVAVPAHGCREFGVLHPFTAERGFVDGVNVLEVDVENADPGEKSPASIMGVLVELRGSVLTAWPEPSAAATTVKEHKSKN